MHVVKVHAHRLSPHTTMHHAVCATGLERSFPEIAGNIAHILSALNHSTSGRLETFGIEPTNETWSPTVRKHLMLRRSQTFPQRRCHQNSILPWFTCTRGGRTTRGGRCADSFVQSLCDLQACERVLQAFEARHSLHFTLVARLRLDIAFEAEIAVPSIFSVRSHGRSPQATASLATAIDENTVWVPQMNSQGGLNDKFAIGGRRGMAHYLNRVDLVDLNFSRIPRDAKQVAAPFAPTLPLFCPQRVRAFL